jgi:hypothetical protein
LGSNFDELWPWVLEFSCETIPQRTTNSGKSGRQPVRNCEIKLKRLWSLFINNTVADSIDFNQNKWGNIQE